MAQTKYREDEFGLYRTAEDIEQELAAIRLELATLIFKNFRPEEVDRFAELIFQIDLSDLVHLLVRARETITSPSN